MMPLSNRFCFSDIRLALQAMTEYSDIEVIENDIEEKLEGHSLSAEEKDCEISSKVSVNLGYEYEDINASEGCNKEGPK